MIITQCRIWIPPWEVILYYYVTSVQVFIIHPGGGRITDNLCIDDSHLNNLRSYLYLRRHQTTPIFIAPHISPTPPAVLAHIREHISCSLFISLAAWTGVGVAEGFVRKSPVFVFIFPVKDSALSPFFLQGFRGFTEASLGSGAAVL